MARIKLSKEEKEVQKVPDWLFSHWYHRSSHGIEQAIFVCCNRSHEQVSVRRTRWTTRKNSGCSVFEKPDREGSVQNSYDSDGQRRAVYESGSKPQGFASYFWSSLQGKRNRAQAHSPSASVDKRPGRANEQNHQGGDCASVLLWVEDLSARASSSIFQRVQFRKTIEIPERLNSMGIYS